MKLTLSLLVVCAAVMLSEARPDEIRRVVDVTAMGSGSGEDTVGLSDAYEDQAYGIRSGSAFSSAGKGISVAQSRIRTKEYQTDSTVPVVEPTSSGASTDTAADTAAATSASTAAGTSAGTAASTSAGTAAATSSDGTAGTAAATSSGGSVGKSTITMTVA